MQQCWEQCSELSRDCNACCFACFSGDRAETRDEVELLFLEWEREKYRLVRDSSTVACEVKKASLALDQCYLPFAGMLWERKIL